MTIPVEQFPILSPEQANPFATGLAKGMSLYKQFIINKYLPQQLQQEAQQRDINNQMTQLNLQNLPDLLKQNLLGITSNNQMQQERLKYLPQQLKLGIAEQDLSNVGQDLSNKGQSIYNSMNQLKFEDLPRSLQVDYLTKVLANQGQTLSNQQKEIINQTLPEMNQVDLQGKKLGNQHLSIENKYLRPQLENNILNTYLKNRRETIEQEHLPEELRQEALRRDITNGILSVQNKYAEPNAQANLENIQLKNKFIPMDELIKAQQASQMGSRFGGAYQLARGLQAMSPAARQLWISQHQDEYNEMLSGLGSQTSNNFITPEMMQKYFPLGNSNTQAKSPNMQYQGQQPPQFSSMNPVRFSQSTLEQIKNTQLANQISANNSLTTASTRRQYEGAIQVEGIMNSPEFQSQAQNAAAYAGAMGKGKAAIDALSQTNPKAYEDYLSFKNQTLVLLENRIKTLDQMGATNAQRQELKGLYDKTADALTSNPKQFITQLNNLGRVLNTVAQSVQTSASPLTQQTRIGNFNEIPEQQVNTRTINGKTYYRIGNTNRWKDTR